MRSTVRAIAAGAGALTLMLGAVACGSDDDEGSGGSKTTDEPLKLGYVLPESGSLAYLGPPQIEAMKYAIQQINDAGGVLGKDLPEPVGGDEADDAAVAGQSADRVLSEDVDAIIGAAASGMSLAIIDKITGANVVECSGSNTAPTFTDYDDNGGYYIRTAPSDALQGPVLADVVTGDGYGNVAVVARADDYGKGLANATASALENAGATVALNETYDPKTTNFDAIVQKVVSAKPDAVVVVAFEEGKQILKGLIESGLSPNEGTGFYGADGLRSADLANLVDKNNPAVLDGMKGTAPASADNADFIKSLEEFAPKLKETQFAPQVFDCVNVIALASHASGSTDPTKFKDELNAVTKGGEKCTTFKDCKALLDDGKDIDYDGVSGALDFTDVGEPGTASIEVYGYDKAGKLQTLDTRQAEPLEE